MKPEVDQILGLSASQLLGGIAPLLPTGYAQGAVSLVAFMMILSAQEYERAADIRVAENNDVRALFKSLAAQVGDAELKAKLETAAATADSSLKISALDAANYELRRLLISLHIYMESQPGENARAAEKSIWQTLRALADRRALKLPSQ
ncbi:MAG TPA: hypothetical protein VGT78_08565 [Rhizomicrobium sp.]|nr:hypothetical protein [Rhizomicrobium sp.]